MGAQDDEHTCDPIYLESENMKRCIIIPDSSHRVLFEHALHMQPKRGRLDSESWPRAGNPGRDSRKTDRTEISILAPIP